MLDHTPDGARAGGRARRRCSERLHEWVITVDHKRLGVMYIASGLVFFLVAGLEATLMRLQLAVPEQHRPLAAGLQPPVHHARHDDGVPRRHADPLRLRELPRAADDRRARPGLPAPQRLRLLDVPVRRRCCSTSASSAATACTAPASRPTSAGSPTRRSPRAPSRAATRTDYWIARPAGQRHRQHRAPPPTSSPPSFCMRCPGMTLRRMPLFVWLHAGGVPA